MSRPTNARNWAAKVELSTLPEQTKKVALAYASLDLEASDEEVAHATGLDIETVRVALDELLVHGWFVS